LSVVISRREVVAQEVVDAVARNLDSHDRGRFPGNNAILDFLKGNQIKLTFYQQNSIKSQGRLFTFLIDSYPPF
jgi:hypothetical protein